MILCLLQILNRTNIPILTAEIHQLSRNIAGIAGFSLRQELDVLPRSAPWQVALCTPNALIETLQDTGERLGNSPVLMGVYTD